MLINDASITGSLTVNASASFQNIIVSGNILPDTNNTRNLGSTDKYFKEIYVSTGSINFVDGASVVAVLNAGTLNAIQTNTSSANSRLNAIESVTSSFETKGRGIISGSSQLPSGIISGSSQLPSGIISGSSQLTSSYDGRYALSSSFNTFTSSATARLNSLETTSASVNTTLSGINIKTGSYATTGSNSFNGNQTITGSLTVSCVATISSSYVGNNSSMTLNSGSNFYIQNGGAAEITGSLRISGSLNLIGTTNLATTGSNTFYGTQIISGTTWIAGDFIVQGSSSIQNITGSSINIGTNIINVNTANPAVRYAGLSVQDSGSANGVTGSLLWDSTCNRWMYSNPSTVGYSGGIIMSGPRAATLGTETTLTCNYIAKSGGGDHLYDSCIWEMSGSMGINTSSPAVSLHVDASGGGIIRATRLGSGAEYIQLEADGTNGTLTSSNGLLINTGGSQRVNITSTGIACFSNQICIPRITINGSDDGNGSLWVNAGSSTMNAGRFRGCSSNYSVLDICNNYAGGIGVYAEAGKHYFGGCVGIGITTPTSILHISTTTPTLKLTDSAATGNNGDVYLRAEKTGVGYNNLTTVAYSYNLKGGASETSFLNIGSTGIACFSSQVCVGGNMIVNGGTLLMNCDTTTSNDARINFYTKSSSTGDRVALYGYNLSATTTNCEISYQAFGYCTLNNQGYINFQTKNTSGWCNTMYLINGRVGIGVANPSVKLQIDGSLTLKSSSNQSVQIWNDGSVGANIGGNLEFRGTYRNSDNDSVIYGKIFGGKENSSDGNFAGYLSFSTYEYPNSLAERLKIASSGVACFSNTACVKSLVTNEGGIQENFAGTGGGHINRYFAAKYMPENQTTAFFKITTSGASATYINLVGTNAGVGWYSSQVYHAANSAYWGGWIGGGAQISLIGTSAGYITGTHSDGAGGQIFCVLVGNNGTGTSSLIFAYITTVTYGGYSTTFTQL